MVVDECDSTMGCDGDHDYQPPCVNNIVNASRAVWKALDVPHDQWGGLDITWTEAKFHAVIYVSECQSVLLLLFYFLVFILCMVECSLDTSYIASDNTKSIELIQLNLQPITA